METRIFCIVRCHWIWIRSVGFCIKDSRLFHRVIQAGNRFCFAIKPLWCTWIRELYVLLHQSLLIRPFTWCFLSLDELACIERVSRRNMEGVLSTSEWYGSFLGSNRELRDQIIAENRKWFWNLYVGWVAFRLILLYCVGKLERWRLLFFVHPFFCFCLSTYTNFAPSTINLLKSVV